MKKTFSNALIHSGSPYLRQHAHNPVNWVEWTDDIPNLARQQDKLILVSIGYSSCHWCHVMEKECFEQEDIAAIMNKNFICVKVDREERPDLDQLYMDALQLMTGQGGWPLNMFTLPDGRPLHGGTYFPKGTWAKLLTDLAAYYETNKEDAYAFATRLSQGIKNLNIFEPALHQNTAVNTLEKALQHIEKLFDLNWGAYQWAPKFPLPNHWDLYMKHHALGAQSTFAEASRITLLRMMHGGIHDVLAGGFCRYSTDSIWKVPHFEKMLYDNAQLLGTYAFAAHYMQMPVFLDVCNNIHRFLSVSLKDKQSGWYAALDADSEGEEGLYYVWHAAELEDILEEAYSMFASAYDITEEGNWEHQRNILHRVKSDQALATEFNLSVATVQEQLQQAHKLLLLERYKRQSPGLDNKIICSWNALTIQGYAKASLHAQRPDWLETAKREMDLLLAWAWHDKTLYRIKEKDGGRIPGFADDYAHTAAALIAVYENTSEEKYALHALNITEQAIYHFYDANNGLFRTRSQYLPQLVTHKTDIHDDVIPCANSVLAHVLYKLSFYFDKPSFESMTEKMLMAVLPRIEKYPSGFSNWGQLILDRHKGFTQVVISGPNAIYWREEINKQCRINTVCLLHQQVSQLPLLAEKPVSHTETIAWICTDKTCGLPQTELAAVITALNKATL